MTPYTLPASVGRATLAALVTNIGIVITGGVVRLSGSGLGCPSWPQCEPGSLVPNAASEHASWQTAVEFGNRLLTFVVLAAVVMVVLELRRHTPAQTRLRRIAWLLPLGVVAQAAVGGITVLTGLAPATVAIHFLLSMGLIAVAMLVHREVSPDTHTVIPASRSIQQLTTAVVAASSVVLLLGTLVTAAGPHGGDFAAARLSLNIRLVAIAHADAVWLLLGLTIALLVATRHTDHALRTSVVLLFGIQLTQGSIGYLQYWLGIPASVVSFHIAGAAILWAFTINVFWRARGPLFITAS
ncbi:MAG: COX15/CtaA family protein [Nitriliruptoraceae bacterium]